MLPAPAARFRRLQADARGGGASDQSAARGPHELAPRHSRARVASYSRSIALTSAPTVCTSWMPLTLCPALQMSLQALNSEPPPVPKFIFVLSASGSLSG